MLHRYAFANFQSFLDRTEVDLTLSARVPQMGWQARAVSGQRLSTALAVIGPNGGGKTALLKPLVFLQWFVKSSFFREPDAPIPFAPHFAAADQPAEFEVEGEDEAGQLWRYVLRATTTRVMHEALYRKKERFNYVFVRDWDEAAGHYTVKQQGFGFNAAEARKVRANASLISTAAQYGVQEALHLASFALRTNIDFMGRRPYALADLFEAAELFADNTALQSEMNRLLTSWDFGLGGVKLTQQMLERAGEGAKKVWVPMGVHTTRDGGEHELAFLHESSGTQGAFVLLSRLLPALASGGLAVIDEFENDLHPHMLEPILDLFASEIANPKRAQIVFTCHAMEVLNVLHKSQVMLVEKNEACESSAWRMDSVQGIRHDDNFYAKYMAGAYGAVPRV